MQFLQVYDTHQPVNLKVIFLHSPKELKIENTILNLHSHHVISNGTTMLIIALQFKGSMALALKTN